AGDREGRLARGFSPSGSARRGVGKPRLLQGRRAVHRQEFPRTRMAPRCDGTCVEAGLRIADGLASDQELVLSAADGPGHHRQLEAHLLRRFDGASAHALWWTLGAGLRGVYRAPWRVESVS